jgi:hypothetical protein
MNITSKASRVILLSVVCILVPTLSSCGQAGQEAAKIVGGAVVSYAINEALDCTVKGGCNAKAEPKADSKAGPDKTIENYYQLINQRQYSDAWAILSRRFQEIKPDNNFNNYTQWWDSVEKVTVDSIKLIEENNGSAIVYADLNYLMKNGRKVDDKNRFTLIKNENGKWLIDSVEDEADIQKSKSQLEKPQSAEATVPTPTSGNNGTQPEANRPMLGVKIVSLTPELRQQINQNKNLNLSINVDKGVLIVEVEKGYPAAEAGIQSGDVIVAINGKTVTADNELTSEIQKTQVGAELPLQIYRGQQKLEIPVLLR